MASLNEGAGPVQVDDSLAALEDSIIDSGAGDDVVYRLGGRLGPGHLSVPFFAIRKGPQGDAPVVMKIFRPSVVRDAEPTVMLSVRKEAVALGRLNERLPPTPYVVRLIDTGTTSVVDAIGARELPWLAVEYVHGGAEGRTLADRVRQSVERTGLAFDPMRAAHAIECLASGLEAAHEVGVIHRDVTPVNVLCCGFGDNEIFKLTDFGQARPLGLSGTFSGAVVGTLGYAAPEQTSDVDSGTGPWSDVFGMAAVAFFLLTGQHYFPAQTLMELVELVYQAERPKIAQSPALSRELAQRPASCEAIDRVLEAATSVDWRARPQTARELCTALVTHLREGPTSSRPNAERVRSVITLVSTLESEAKPTSGAGLRGWRWTLRQHTRPGTRVRSVAWDGDGRCLAVTDQNIEFWGGTGWSPLPPESFGPPGSVRFSHRIGPASWLLGGKRGMLGVCSHYGGTGLSHFTDSSVTLELASGDFEDVGVVVGTPPVGPPTLWAITSGRWSEPSSLIGADHIASIARLDASRWLVAGSAPPASARGFAALYAPFSMRIEGIPLLDTGPLVACAGEPQQGIGLLVASNGTTARLEGGEITYEIVRGAENLSAGALDILGRAWVAGTGSIWLRQSAEQGWVRAFREPSLNEPIISLVTEPGVIRATTQSGGIIEGRLLEDG